MKRKAAPAAERVIKRYENRKLYDAVARRHVTLDDVAKRVAGGEELRVVEQKTGEDITNAVLAQVILEGIKERTSRIPRQVLARLIRLGSGPASAVAERTAQEMASRTRVEAERIVQGLLSRGRLSLEEALSLRQEIADSVGKLVAEAQRGLESRLHGLLERTENEGAVGPSLQGLKERLMAFETYLDVPDRAQKGRGRKRG
ncbi:MAG: polyhydroxyalkanoate synthesis regulator DNA-binding domain-containing protein [Acidobacteria bacterium]|nr:polyhydroxyalkanoate synthesis regulator DNA-binding domain-containing protein [Acidobacteriota bacterium]